MSDRSVRLIVKKTAIPSRVPSGTTGSESNLIKQGELALNTADQKLFSYDGSNIFEIGAKSYLNLSGGTVVGDLDITGSISATTIYSGGTDLSDLFGGETNIYNSDGTLTSSRNLNGGDTNILSLGTSSSRLKQGGFKTNDGMFFNNIGSGTTGFGGYIDFTTSSSDAVGKTNAGLYFNSFPTKVGDSSSFDTSQGSNRKGDYFGVPYETGPGKISFRANAGYPDHYSSITRSEIALRGEVTGVSATRIGIIHRKTYSSSTTYQGFYIYPDGVSNSGTTIRESYTGRGLKFFDRASDEPNVTWSTDDNNIPSIGLIKENITSSPLSGNPINGAILSVSGNNLSTGDFSFAIGSGTTASGNASFSEGLSNKAIGIASHAEGYSTTASGPNSHSEGEYTTALGNNTHAGGSKSSAIGPRSFIHSSGSTVISSESAILGGQSNMLTPAAFRSVILGGQSITGETEDTVYGINFNAQGSVSATSFYSGSTNLLDIFATESLSYTQASHGLSVGDMVSISGSVWTKSIANSSADINDSFVTNYVSSVVDANTINIGTVGSTLDIDLGYSSATAIYLSQTVLGGLTDNQYSSGFLQQVGWYYDGRMFFNPEEYVDLDTTGDNADITRVQSGVNTFTGGTENLPTINVTGLTVDNITVSGESSFTSLSATTFYSGSTDVETIIRDLSGGGPTAFTAVGNTGVTYAWDVSVEPKITITITADTTITISNHVNGGEYQANIKQDGTGGHEVTIANTAIVANNGIKSPLALSTIANDTNKVFIQYDGVDISIDTGIGYN